uniref:CSON011327 protein n=1 Tax=Culicoides sonorensis TaxID=179676 RepID=A0A336M7B3_CULSO
MSATVEQETKSPETVRKELDFDTPEETTLTSQEMIEENAAELLENLTETPEITEKGQEDVEKSKEDIAEEQEETVKDQADTENIQEEVEKIEAEHKEAVEEEDHMVEDENTAEPENIAEDENTAEDENIVEEAEEEEQEEPMEVDSEQVKDTDMIEEDGEEVADAKSDPKDSQEEEPMTSEDEDAQTEGSKSRNGAKTDDNLMSEEQLDRESPEIWPEKVPGAKSFVQEHTSAVSEAEEVSSSPTWTKGLTQDDIDQMHKLGAMTNNQLILEIKKLYDQTYKIGVEEAKEMTRGKILQIFNNTKKK